MMLILRYGFGEDSVSVSCGSCDTGNSGAGTKEEIEGLVIIPKGRNAIQKKADRIRKNVREVTNVIIEETRM